MTSKERFEEHMKYYFPRLDLRPGRICEYNDKYVQMAWFFYEQGLRDMK